MSDDDMENGPKDAMIEEKDNETSKTPVSVPKRKIIRAPQPKLDADRLRGERGLKTIEDFFKTIKLKGPGYEEHDLNLTMKNLEIWCNQLFPKMAFDDCLEKIEKLGSKKVISTYMYRIRTNTIDQYETEQTVPTEEIEEQL